MRTPATRRASRGFTLVELAACVAILAVAAGIALAALGDRDGLHARQAESLFRDALADARMLAVRNPARTLLLRFDADGRGWWLADADLPAVPLAREGARIRFGEGHAHGLGGVRIEADRAELRFDRYGGLAVGDDAAVRFASGAASVGVSVRRLTGAAAPLTAAHTP